MKNTRLFSLLLILVTMLLAACTGGKPSANEKLHVLATTSMVADVVRQVGGEYVQVTTLLPLGTDPHTFEPRPQDVAAIEDAQIVFANGAGLEEFLEPLLKSAGAMDKLVEVSQGIELLPLEGIEHSHEHEEEEHSHEGEEHSHEGGMHHHQGGDPHTWMDPNNVLIWVENIATALAKADPRHAKVYRAHAEAYANELRALDAWIREQVAQVPPENRVLVADHAVFGYFAEEYGFRQLGTITHSFSTGASPSAQELAALEDQIRTYGVKAIFVGADVNQNLAKQIAADTGVRIVQLYHGSLTDAQGPAPTYLDFMRYNVTAIVEALK
ncbi:MAG: metal ABC transporter substrate-binding protein [Anaerolineales bacterium]|nr:metal ABC transporter substrate-binding protein [Anaerolineales bacterium]MDW8228171.1 metal ABC transporter substrate-binding protein [Anaerolineales bacterium]